MDRAATSVAVWAGVLIAAVLVFLSAGQAQGLGPLDLDTADRLALGLWVGAPAAGGLAGRGSGTSGLLRAALVVGIAVAVIAALFPSSGTGNYTCWINLPSVPFGYLIGRIVIGAVIGIGMGLGLYIAGAGARRIVTAVPGLIVGVAVTYVTSAAAYELFYGGVRCLQ